jgi:hypothetical protein
VPVILSTGLAYLGEGNPSHVTAPVVIRAKNMFFVTNLEQKVCCGPFLTQVAPEDEYAIS